MFLSSVLCLKEFSTAYNALSLFFSFVWQSIHILLTGGMRCLFISICRLETCLSVLPCEINWQSVLNKHSIKPIATRCSKEFQLVFVVQLQNNWKFFFRFQYAVYYFNFIVVAQLGNMSSTGIHCQTVRHQLCHTFQSVLTPCQGVFSCNTLSNSWQPVTKTC